MPAPSLTAGEAAGGWLPLQPDLLPYGLADTKGRGRVGHGLHRPGRGGGQPDTGVEWTHPARCNPDTCGWGAHGRGEPFLQLVRRLGDGRTAPLRG
ncbi:MAG: hypothetical protein R3A10_11815 [Caldilineaceae bacterium]